MTSDGAWDIQVRSLALRGFPTYLIQWQNKLPDGVMLKSHMHLMQYVDQVCIRCGSVKVTLCPLMSSVDGVCTCTTHFNPY